MGWSLGIRLTRYATGHGLSAAVDLCAKAQRCGCSPTFILIQIHLSSVRFRPSQSHLSLPYSASSLASDKRCTMLRSVLSRAPSPAPLARRAPVSLGLHLQHVSPARGNSHCSSLKTERSPAAALSSTSYSEPGPSTLRSASSPASLHSFRSHSILGSGANPSRLRRFPTRPLHLTISHARAFHSTHRNQLNPLPFLGVLLKVSISRHAQSTAPCMPPSTY